MGSEDRKDMLEVFAMIKDRYPSYTDSEHLFLDARWRTDSSKVTYDDLVLELHFLMRKIR